MYISSASAGTNYDIHSCILIRSSKDTALKASVFDLGTDVKYRIGYRLYDSNKAIIPNVGT